MDDKERKWFNELVAIKMNEIVMEVEEREEPEPQAGDVWLENNSRLRAVFLIHKKDPFRDDGALTYTFDDGSGGNQLLRDLCRKSTRVFSLVEHLKKRRPNA